MQGNLFANSRPVAGYPILKKNQIVLWGDNNYGNAQSDPNKPLHDQIWAIEPPAIDRSNPPNVSLYNDTTYWILRVPKQIIANHGDVWNPNTASLLSGLFRMSGMVPERDPYHPDQYTKASYKLRSLSIQPMNIPQNSHLTKCAPYPKVGEFH